MLKKTILSCLVILISFSAMAQAQSDSRKLSRKERRELEKNERIERKKVLLEIVKSKEFVLEANKVYDPYRHVIFVAPNVNFVAFAEDWVTIQLSAFENIPGWAGVGRITFDGKINTFKIEEGKGDKDIYVEVRINGAGIASNMFININPGGRGALEILGDQGGRVTFEGDIVPLSESSVFKAQIIK